MVSEVSFQWKYPDFLLKNVDFLLKNVDFLLKNVDFYNETQKELRTLFCVRFCIKTYGFCIKNDEFCIKIDEFCIKIDNRWWTSTRTGESTRRISSRFWA